MRSRFHLPFARTFAPPALLCCLWLALFVLGVGGCNEGSEIGATQVTARIYFASDVRAALNELRVRSYRGDSDRFSLRSEHSYAKSKLQAVMDIRFTPGDGDSAGTVLVVADALSQSGAVLVEARATFVFVPGEERLFELWLYRCGDAALGTLCAQPSCADSSCLTCVHDRCAATPLYSKPQLTTFDPTLAADPEKPPPGHAAVTAEPARDAGAAPAGDERDAAASSEVAEAGVAAEDACVEPCAVATAQDSGQMDAGRDAGDEPTDAGASDAGSEEPSDAGSSDGARDAQEPPGRCAEESNWTSSQTNAPIPAQARALAEHTNASGTLPQYLCRMRTPDGVALTPGKVSGSAASPGNFDRGCYGTYYGTSQGRPGTQSWQSFASEAQGGDFQVLTPASECQLDWVRVNAGQPLPARALAVGNSGGARPQPLYACRVSVSDATTSGTHIGRVGGVLGDTCHVQYYQQAPLDRAQFEVLVQTRP